MIVERLSRNVTLEQMEELYDFLSVGTLPESVGVPNPPKLGPDLAFTIIWFLQEHMHVLPDRFECCHDCGSIFDSHAQGDYNEETGKSTCGCVV
jgi:hypothetical protein